MTDPWDLAAFVFGAAAAAAVTGVALFVWRPEKPVAEWFTVLTAIACIAAAVALVCVGAAVAPT